MKEYKKGMALVTVLLLTLLMVLMTVSMVFISTNFLNLFGNSEIRTKALKAAESGVEYSLYMLNNDPSWGTSGLTFDDNVNILPSFNRNNFSYTEMLPDKSRFTIIFSEDIKYGSVNNLFSNNTVNNIPPYTVKIVSAGEAPGGKAKKILEAYLVRADFYPYSLNSEGSVVLSAGNYFVEGNETGISKPPGTIYSGWIPLTESDFSISSTSQVKQLSCNNGYCIGKGNINVPVSNDTNLQPDYKKNLYLGKINVSAILDCANSGNYGSVTHISPGKVIIKDEKPSPPGSDGTYELKSELAIKDNSTGFTDPSVVIEKPDTIKLMRDLYIEDETKRTDVYNNRFKTIPEISTADTNVFRIVRDLSAVFQETYKFVVSTYSDEYGTYVDVNDNLLKQSPFHVRLDLNGHTIYSNSHLILGLEIVGHGRIISYGKVDCLLGVNNEEVSIISEDDLIVELADSTVNPYTKGLFYSGDDINILPIPADSLLLPGGTGGFGTKTVAEYPPGFKFTDSFSNATGVGICNISEPDKVPEAKDYSGNGMLISKLKISNPDTGILETVLLAEGTNHDELQFCLEYNGNKQKKLSTSYKMYIKPVSDVDCEVYILDTDDNKVDPVTITDFYMASDQLNIFGKEVIDFFNKNSGSYAIRLDSTLTSLNRYRSDWAHNIENLTIIDTGATSEKDGEITLKHDIAYMSDLLNLQRKYFKVRLLSCYEIE